MTELIGMKEICNFMKRSEPTILSLHRDMEFPMKKIGGVWESDTELISEWRRKVIFNGSDEPAKNPAKRTGKRQSSKSVAA